MKLNILGTEWEVKVKRYDEDKAFKERSIVGYCSWYEHEIVLCDMHTYDGWEDESEGCIVSAQKEALRHEIVHAFFDESGLMDSSNRVDRAWARNEEMVDWIALQGPKIYEAWREADAI